ncbi:MAG: hypothetical protein Q7U80_02790 [Thiobacillus sp.]|nr:hypothetical protein [Thiobacillus sp.]
MTDRSALEQFEFSESEPCREFVTPSIQTADRDDMSFEIAWQHSLIDGRNSKDLL